MKTSLLLASLLAFSSATFAEGSSPESVGPWSVHVGPASVKFHTGATVSLGGSVIPGAGVDASTNTALALEVAYAMSPNVSGRFTMGVPPTTKLTGTGPLAGAGELGRVRYGPAVLSFTWAFDGLGPVLPYLGAGLNGTLVLNSEDGAITSLKVKSAFGSVLQAGLDIPLDRNWGVFADVKKVYVKTSATGMVGAAPAYADVRLDPLLIHAGVNYRF